MPKTKAVRIAATIQPHPHKPTIPKATKLEETSLAAVRLADALKSTASKPNETGEALQNQHVSTYKGADKNQS